MGEEARPEAEIARSTPSRSESSARVPCVCGLLRPALEPALVRALALEARLVADEPEEDEVGVGLAVQHRLEVELDVGLAGERGVVAEQAQRRPLMTKPQRCSSERFRSSCTRPCGEWWRRRRHPASAVERDVAADEVDRDVLPGVRDRVGLALDLDRLRGLQPPVAELLEEHEQPALPRRVVPGSSREACARASRKCAQAPTSRFQDRTIASFSGRSARW